MPCLPGISSMSLGRAWEHALFTKLAEASKAGFRGIEIFYEDLEYLASTYTSSPSSHATDSSSPNLLKAAADVHKWCQDFHLEVICLQPFMFYEGLTDRNEHAQRISKLHLWFELVRILHTDMILIPSNTTPDPAQTTSDTDAIVSDLLEVATLGAQQSPPVRFAYENLAWGTHVDTWEQAYSLVQKVNRPNFGLCLDSFNILGRIWADPTTPSGLVPNAEQILHDSLSRLSRLNSTTTEDPRQQQQQEQQQKQQPPKIFFIQITDAERMTSPLIPNHPWYTASQPARMTWSRNARLFAYEAGGHLPISRLLDVIFHELRFEGWVSMELFSRTMEDPDGSVPEGHARRGMASWREMERRYGLS